MTTFKMWRWDRSLDVTTHNAATTVGQANFLSCTMNANVQLIRDGEVIYERLVQDKPLAAALLGSVGWD